MYTALASFQGSSPAFTACDKKLGTNLGTRLYGTAKSGFSVTYVCVVGFAVERHAEEMLGSFFDKFGKLTSENDFNKVEKLFKGSK